MGKFIVVEGLDGSGKSSQIEILANQLESRGEKVYITAEPTNFETGTYLRRILTNSLQMDINLQAALFAADRIEHNTDPNNGIKKYLSEGYTVICDRYYYSSLAYQGKNPDCDFEWVLNLNLKCNVIQKPDLCIFLDVNPATCKNRIDTSREKIELYEKNVEQMNCIRNGFLEVIELLRDKFDHKIVVIDANDNLNNVSKEIMKYV